MNADDRIRQAYDDIPYDSYPYAVSHPDRMAVVAALKGLTTPAVARCRVLELGCASAGNIIPMAEGLPNARFVGIDLSPRQIEQGVTLVRELRLGNIKLIAQSIMDFPEDAGEFDYIIAHGLYSWVPDEVRDQLLKICERHLARNGVCFISCKTFPGWHMNNVLRDLMNFHSRDQTGGAAQATAAREILQFAVSAFDNPSPQSQVARQMAANLLNAPQMYLSHDHLSTINHPVLFKEFAAHAQSHGLKYLGHADPISDSLWRLPPDRQQRIAGWSASPIDQEQYGDFLCWRSMRANILCRADAPVDSRSEFEAISTLHLAGRPVETAQGGASPAVVFSAGDPAITATDLAVIHAFKSVKAAWPNSVPFHSLMRDIPASMRGDENTLVRRIADHVLAAYRCRILELWCRPVDFVGTGSVQPRSTVLARWQAARSMAITTLRHEMYPATANARRLLSILDGTRDLSAIIRLLSPHIASGEISQLLRILTEESLLLA